MSDEIPVVADGGTVTLKWFIPPTVEPWLTVPKWVQTLQGRSKVIWHLNSTGAYRPIRAENVCVEGKDGRYTCYRCQNGGTKCNNWKRDTDDPEYMQIGSLEIAQGSLLFRDGNGPRKPHHRIKNENDIEKEERILLAEHPWLETRPHSFRRVQVALSKHEAFLEAIQTNSFAITLARVLVRNDLIHKETGKKVFFTTDDEGGIIVASLRGLGEIHQEFWMGRPTSKIIPPENFEGQGARAAQFLQEVGYLVVAQT